MTRSPGPNTVGIVGPGRVGGLLAVACAQAGLRVTAVAGGSDEARATLCDVLGDADDVARTTDVPARAELVLVSVPDDAIAAVAKELARANVLTERHRVVHLAGSRGTDVLRLAALAGARVAACHPAMTIPAGSRDPRVLDGVAWAVTAAAGDRVWAHRFVTVLRGAPFDVGEDRRALYHASLVVGANAAGAAVSAARQLLLAAGVGEPERFLAPVITASVDNVLARGAVALTGPVARGDAGTISAHLAAIDRDLPELSDTYRHLAEATLLQAAPGLDPAARKRVADALVSESLSEH